MAYAPTTKNVYSVLERSGVPQTTSKGELTPDAFFNLGSLVSGRLSTWSGAGSLPIREDLYRIGGLEGEYAKRALPPTPTQPPTGATPQVPSLGWEKEWLGRIAQGAEDISTVKKAYDTAKTALKYLSPAPIAGTAGSQTMGKALEGSKVLEPTSSFEKFASSKGPAMYSPNAPFTGSPATGVPPANASPEVLSALESYYAGTAPAASGTAIGVPAANAPGSTTAALENYYAGGSEAGAGAGANVGSVLSKAAAGIVAGMNVKQALEAESGPEAAYHSGLAALAASGLVSGPGALFAAAPAAMTWGLDKLFPGSLAKTAAPHLNYSLLSYDPAQNKLVTLPKPSVKFTYDKNGFITGVENIYLSGAAPTKKRLSSGMTWDYPNLTSQTAYYDKYTQHLDPGGKSIFDYIYNLEQGVNKVVKNFYSKLYQAGSQITDSRLKARYYNELTNSFRNPNLIPDLYTAFPTGKKMWSDVGTNLQNYSKALEKNLTSVYNRLLSIK